MRAVSLRIRALLWQKIIMYIYMYINWIGWLGSLQGRSSARCCVLFKIRDRVRPKSVFFLFLVSKSLRKIATLLRNYLTCRFAPRSNSRGEHAYRPCVLSLIFGASVFSNISTNWVPLRRSNSGPEIRVDIPLRSPASCIPADAWRTRHRTAGTGTLLIRRFRFRFQTFSSFRFRDG